MKNKMVWAGLANRNASFGKEEATWASWDPTMWALALLFGQPRFVVGRKQGQRFPVVAEGLGGALAAFSQARVAIWEVTVLCPQRYSPQTLTRKIKKASPHCCEWFPLHPLLLQSWEETERANLGATLPSFPGQLTPPPPPAGSSE